MSEKEWTSADNETLRAMWHRGDSLSVIGREFGVSRSAIAGKARRMNLPWRKQQAETDEVRRKKRLAKNREYREKRRRAAAKKPPKIKKEKAPPKESAVSKLLTQAAPVKEEPNTARLTYDEATIPREAIAGASCLYIYGHDYVERIWRREPIFCGEATIEGVRYCAAHAKKCYEKATRRRGDPNMKNARWAWNK